MKKTWFIGIGAGVIALILGVVLIGLILREDEEVVPDVAVPETEFVFDSEEEYGEGLKFSSEIKETVFWEFSERAYEEITRRISAWFAINYPRYDSFALVKDSYKKQETETKEKRSMKLVSNFGTIIGLELIDDIKENYTTKTTIRILTIGGEEAYKTEIKWEEI